LHYSANIKKNQILEIIQKEGLFLYNIFNEHSQKANEIIINHKNGQYIIFRTDKKIKLIFRGVECFIKR
jgi:hypothetical protein